LISIADIRQTGVDFVLTFSRQFLAGLAQLGLLMILAQHLGPEGAGVYTVALLVPSIMSQLLNFGLVSANVYFLASRQFSLEQVWAASRDLTLLLCCGGLILGAGLVLVFGGLAFPGIPPTVLLLALLIYPASLMGGIVSGLFQALQDFKAFNIAVLIQPIVSVILVCLLWLADEINIEAVVIAVVLAHWIALIIALFLLGRRVPLNKSGMARMLYLSRAIRYGIKAHLGNLIVFLNYRLDIFLVNLLVGPTGAGLYTIAVRMAEQIWLISRSVSTVIFPRLSAMAEDDAARRAFTPLMGRMVLHITLIASLLLALLAHPLLLIFFGREFTGAETALLILLPGIVLMSLGRVIANDFAARGWVGINMLLAFFVLLANTMANIILIPKYGFFGAAIATTLSYTLNVSLRLFLQWHLIGVPLKEFMLLSLRDISIIKQAFSRVVK
jgi:O-antigen/teichoic acid export membrane protein